MKILVLGHSDSDGSHLPDASDAWPWLLQRLLADQRIAAEVVHKYLFAGPTAAEFVGRQLEKEQPEVVVVATSTFGVLVKSVSKRMRRRFGDRAGNLAGRAERLVARHPGPDGSLRAKALVQVRRVGRRVLGADGDFSYNELLQCYEDCFRAIAKHEETHAVIMGGAAYTKAVWRLNPGSERLQAASNIVLREAALAHRFDWFSHEELLGGLAGKARFYYDDGVHTHEESHRLVAEAVVPLVVARTLQ